MRKAPNNCQESDSCRHELQVIPIHYEGGASNNDTAPVIGRNNSRPAPSHRSREAKTFRNRGIHDRPKYSGSFIRRVNPDCEGSYSTPFQVSTGSQRAVDNYGLLIPRTFWTLVGPEERDTKATSSVPFPGRRMTVSFAPIFSGRSRIPDRPPVPDTDCNPQGFNPATFVANKDSQQAWRLFQKRFAPRTVDFMELPSPQAVTCCHRG